MTQVSELPPRPGDLVIVVRRTFDHGYNPTSAWYVGIFRRTGFFDVWSVLILAKVPTPVGWGRSVGQMSLFDKDVWTIKVLHRSEDGEGSSP